ncbi:MAG: hypothetical protein ABRQ26_03570 [Syntrophomonadaceae bacterium]
MNDEDQTTQMNELINEEVTHIKFGRGVILSTANRIIRIQFNDGIEQKTFIYPDAFERFLKFHNPLLDDRVQKELKVRNDQIALEKEKDRIEAQRREKEWQAIIERKRLENKRIKESATKKTKKKQSK